MRCLKMIFGMAFITFTFIISQEIFVDDTFAVDDIVYVVDSSNMGASHYFCDYSSNVPCDDYHYLLLETNIPIVSSSFSRLDYYQTPRVLFYFKTSGLGNSEIENYFRLLNFPSLYYFEDLTSLRFAQTSYFQNLNYEDWSLTFTLSENNPYSSGITPSGSLSVTENGTYDVTNYAEAVVDVPQSSGGGSGGDYTDELNGVITAIYTCGAVVLVVYFFYCIYRMIIKSTGGR